MFGMDLPRWHAAVNDFPVALLIAAVLFDLAGWLLKRESLLWAGIWTLWGGVIGGWAAVILGLMAEEKIDHGEAIHEIMEAHQTWGIVTMCVFTAVLAWKLLRRFQVSGAEDKVLKIVMVLGLAILVRVGQLGGKLVFEHAAGMPTTMMESEIQNREAGHHHEGGEGEEAEPHEHGDSTATHDSTPHTHVDPPGTPPHTH
jgi:uncharacterized membrane protein